MEVVQGKSTNKKIIIAQEIAFAKVLAGNNKTLRDRAVKKLRKWLTIRGTGKWEFTEEEFIRIWTGLFYCMWMSDKFLIQEELAESISNLIHCFKKNSSSALLFIKCFNKRLLMDWEGLDQYRIDKFNMLIRRFLRQTLIYCKEKNWEESFLHNLMKIFDYVVLHRDSSLGFVLHFINIYPEEIAKVGDGKIDTKTVLILIEPFVKLIARSKDSRIQKECENLFDYLMRQTDAGIEFEEKFNAWREQGYPGEGPHCMGSINRMNGDEDEDGDDDDDVMKVQNGDDASGGEEEEGDFNSKPLDPRAGSVHVFLPQIPLDIDGLIALFKKHKNTRQAESKGRRLLNSLAQKFEALNRGRFPLKIKKSSLLVEKTRKKHQTVKNARKLMEFTQQIDVAPVKTKEYRDMLKDLEDDEKEEENENELFDVKEATETDEKDENAEDIKKVNDSDVEFENEKQDKVKVKNKTKNAKKKIKTQNSNNVSNNNEEKAVSAKKQKNSEKNKIGKEKLEKRKKRKKLQKSKLEGKSTQQILNNQFVMVTPKKKSIEKAHAETLEKIKQDVEKVTPMRKAGTKRKILSNWQVQELDTSSPEYYKIETPKVITIERKTEETSHFDLKENEPKSTTEEKEISVKSPKKMREEFVPIFWQKAKAKANRRSGSKTTVFMNPFAKTEDESKTPNRRISFALEKNMAQENEQYLEEVKNSPRVPFDGSKKPVQSALKSGLSPSPVNPFYRFKKIKL